LAIGIRLQDKELIQKVLQKVDQLKDETSRELDFNRSLAYQCLGDSVKA